MKIICIGKNYADHNKEMESESPKNPIFFTKSDSCILIKNRPFYLPSFSKHIQHEVEIVFRINKLGKHIAEDFAHTYYNEIGIGLDLTARDLQHEAKQKGLPWEISKCFDYSSPISEHFISKEELDVTNIEFSLLKNGKLVQKANSSDMIFSIDKIISYVSRFMTLKIGDLIYTGTPAGVSDIAIGDKYNAFIGEKSLLQMEVK
jgi:2-keto-4-pentenoate hydratase/2-oxohepta-3-ene-1,7-dioic acid hydratase in catechol pathway